MRVGAVTREHLHVTTVDSTTSRAVDRDQTCANAGDGLRNLVLLDFAIAFLLTLSCK